MKKIITFGFISLTLMSLCGVKAHADSETEVSYEIGSEYVLDIPAKIELDDEAKSYLDIKIISSNIDPLQYVELSIVDGLSNDSEISLKRIGGLTENLLTSRITTSGAAILKDKPVIGSFGYTAKANDSAATLFIEAPVGEKKAGTYTTTLTFSSEYKSSVLGED